MATDGESWKRLNCPKINEPIKHINKILVIFFTVTLIRFLSQTYYVEHGSFRGV